MVKKTAVRSSRRGVSVWPRRRPSALTVASALVAAAFTGVFLWLMLGAPDEPPQGTAGPAAPAMETGKTPTGTGTPEAAPQVAMKEEPVAQPHASSGSTAPEPPALPAGQANTAASPPAEQEPAKGISRAVDAPAPAQRTAPTGQPATAPPQHSTEQPAAKQPQPRSPASLPTTAPAPVASPTQPIAPSQPPAIPKLPKAPGAGKPGNRLALAPVPDPALTQRTTKGLLPVIAPDGRQPWQAYARPFAGDAEKPRIAILIVDLGLSQAATKTAIQQLPGAVSLVFSPYARDIQGWIAESRAAGHEAMLQLPMEPYEYPSNDPGPHTLLTSLSDSQNRQRLEWLLGRVTGYVGVTNNHGDKFTASAKHLRPVIKALQQRGLMFLDLRASDRSVAARVAKELNVPRAINNRFIDSPEASRLAIDARLNELERIAQQTGTAVGIGYPRPVTLERIANWATTLALKGIVLSPITSVVNRQEIQ